MGGVLGPAFMVAGDTYHYLAMFREIDDFMLRSGLAIYGVCLLCRSLR